MKKNILILSLFLAVIVTGIFAVFKNNPPTILASSIAPSGYTKAVTSSGVLIGGSSVLVLATSSARNYVELDTVGTPIYCNMDNGNAAKLYVGIHIASSTKYVISPDTDNLYRGAIYCIADSASSATTTVIQY